MCRTSCSEPWTGSPGRKNETQRSIYNIKINIYRLKIRNYFKCQTGAFALVFLNRLFTCLFAVVLNNVGVRSSWPSRPIRTPCRPIVDLSCVAVIFWGQFTSRQYHCDIDPYLFMQIVCIINFIVRRPTSRSRSRELQRLVSVSSRIKCPTFRSRLGLGAVRSGLVSVSA